MPERRNDESPLRCVPGTIFFMMVIDGGIRYLCSKNPASLLLAGVGLLLIWLFYW